MAVNRERAQAKLNKELERAFNSEDGVKDLNFFYDRLTEMGFSEDESIDMIDEAIFYITKK